MIQAASTYIKGIAVFLIIMAYVEVIMPDKGYKQYIGLILGFVLMLMILTPFHTVIRKVMETNPSQLSLLDHTMRLNMSVTRLEREFYDDEQRKAVLETYKKDLREQMTRFLSEYGTVTMLGFDIAESEENFGRLESVYVELERKAQKKKEGFIRIKPVNLSKSGTENEPENEDIKKIKNRISDFYNLSAEHIYVKVSYE